jgi:hypothetical protein
MKHPSKEEWMDFVYGEKADATELRAHLASCADCRRDVESWRATMRTLDAWKLPAEKVSPRGAQWFRWAAAAAVFLSAGIAIGASMRKGPDVGAIEKSIQTLAERIDQERATTALALRDLEARRVSDLVSLRRDLEQVAVATDAGLKMTQNQLVRLASYSGDGVR